MKKPSVLVEFMSPGPRSRVDDRYRIIHPGESGDLLLEKLETDAIGGARWVTAPPKEILCRFEGSPRWDEAWAKCCTPLKDRGSVLSTRFSGIPGSSRGVVHSYTSRNDHGPSDKDQDVYVVTSAMGLDLTSKVQHLTLLPEGKGELVLLGALAILALKEQSKDVEP